MPKLALASEYLVAVDRAATALGEFVGKARQVQNTDLIMAPLRRQEAVLSSRIEGTQTHVRDVLLAEATKATGAPDDSDLREVLNYLDALDAGERWIQDGGKLSLTLLRAMHKTLMRGVREEDKHPGEFRTTQVYIGDRAGGLASARFVPPPSEQVAPLVDNLFDSANREATYGLLIYCAIFHYQFETIHPFEDGNGRIGRLLIPLLLQSASVLDRPVLYISPFLEGHRDIYMDLLWNVSAKSDWTSWILFFLEAVRVQSEDSTSRIRRIVDLHKSYLDRVKTAPKTALLTVDYVMEHPYVTARQIEEYTHTTAPTAKAAIDTLVALQILTPRGRMQGRQVWVAEELLSEVYEES
jgi:Fic family protein